MFYSKYLDIENLEKKILFIIYTVAESQFISIQICWLCTKFSLQSLCENNVISYKKIVLIYHVILAKGR